MNCLRVTKYNPQNRDRNDIYLKKEWTSIGDVGKIFNDTMFTFESYLVYEEAYIDAILRIMRENKLKSFKIEALEKKSYVNYNDFFDSESQKYFSSLKNNMVISIHDITPIIRFTLRELIWCKLISHKMFVHFGYDYYMYIGSEKQLENVLEDIKNNGLFIEPMVSPYM